MMDNDRNCCEEGFLPRTPAAYVGAFSVPFKRLLGILFLVLAFDLFRRAAPPTLTYILNFEQSYFNPKNASSPLPPLEVEEPDSDANSTIFAGHDKGFTGNAAVLLALLQLSTSKRPNAFFESWEFSDPEADFCHFSGVLCDGQSHIISLDIRYTPGNFSEASPLPHLGANLSTLNEIWVENREQAGYLRELSISDIGIGGRIPASLFRVKNLTKLCLPGNDLEGSFPVFGGKRLVAVDLSRNRISAELAQGLRWLEGSGDSLEYLNLSSNRLVGDLSLVDFSGFRALRVLDLHGNFLAGVLPAVSRFGRTSSLNLAWNRVQGTLSDQFRSGSSLVSLSLRGNRLSGDLPSLAEVFGTHRGLRDLDLSRNNFTGRFPEDAGRLRDLVGLDLSHNGFLGTLPEGMCGEASRLEVLRVHGNGLTGKLPGSFRRCRRLVELSVAGNRLGGSFPEAYGSLSNLVKLDASFNQLSGNLPRNFSGWRTGSLRYLSLSGNNFSGTLSPELGTIPTLREVYLSGNRLSGDLVRLGTIQVADFSGNLLSGTPLGTSVFSASLVSVNLSRNNFSGEFPGDFGTRYPNLASLDLSQNAFSGDLPASIGSLGDLEVLNLQGNLLCGFLPPGILNLARLAVLQLQGNKVNGFLPRSFFSDLAALTLVNLSSNQLNGTLTFPEASSLPLQTLDLSFNWFSGKIPPVGSFPELSSLSLQSNLLSGDLPASLAALPALAALNLSGNDLSGPIPSGRLLTFQEASFVGNPGLCGPPLSQPCPGRIASLAVWKLAVIGVCMLLTVTATFLAIAYNQTKGMAVFPPGKGARALSFRDVRRALHHFQSPGTGYLRAERLQVGGQGTVHMVTFDDDFAVAVKLLEGERKEQVFKSEVFALRGISHPNVVKLLGCCRDASQNLLFYEFVPGGSLAPLLKSTPLPGWRESLKILLGAARGLQHLHSLNPAILHRDVKPDNILITGEGEAKIADFGHSRALLGDSWQLQGPQPGTDGYIAPECKREGQRGQFSRKSDVYSFGVTALYTVTGRNPGQGSSRGGGFVDWVRTNGVRDAERKRRAVTESELFEVQAVLLLALECCETEPEKRPGMGEVADRLAGIAGDLLEAA